MRGEGSEVQNMSVSAFNIIKIGSNKDDKLALHEMFRILEIIWAKKKKEA